MPPMKKVYDSIHNLPIYYFNLINRTTDPLTPCKVCYKCNENCRYKYLLINPDDPIPQNINLENTWDKIMDEYVEEYGLNEAYERYLMLRVTATKHYTNVVIKNQLHELNLAKKAEAEANRIIGSIEGSNLIDAISHVAKFMGFRIDMKLVTVAEFYGYIELMSNGKNTK